MPGTTNSPPDGEETGAWYRRSFEVPADWAGRAVTLRFGYANYVADVWLNGVWLGYHEGGSTPFAFEAGAELMPGQDNALAVRVHTIPLGTRRDTVPRGLIDWWNYGGLTGSVWLEASAPSHVARADVVTHLDAVEVEVLLSQARRLAGVQGPASDAESDPGALVLPGATAMLRATILAASVDDDNLLDPDPRSLVADITDPLAVVEQEVPAPRPGDVAGTTIALEFGDADPWTPAVPSLYVLRLQLLAGAPPLEARDGRDRDEFWTTFGIRDVAVCARWRCAT